MSVETTRVMIVNRENIGLRRTSEIALWRHPADRYRDKSHLLLWCFALQVHYITKETARCVCYRATEDYNSLYYPFTAETFVKESIIRSRSQRTFESAVALSIHSTRQGPTVPFGIWRNDHVTHLTTTLSVCTNFDVDPTVQFETFRDDLL